MKTRCVHLYSVVLALFFNGCGDDSKPTSTTKLPSAMAVHEEIKPPVVDTRPSSDPPQPPLVKGGSEAALVKGGKDATTAPAAEAVPAFQPLWDARVGEWAMYSALGARALRYEIAEIDGPTVRTRVLVYDHDKLLGQPATREDAREVDTLAKEAATHKADRTVTQTHLEIMNKTWDAWLYEDRWIDEGIHYVRRSWVSNDVPVLGLLKMELYGDETLEARLELTNYGPIN